ncbi:MAG TPA: hypothetical protein VF069_24170 [Streptosporangiaceae bacterium]
MYGALWRLLPGDRPTKALTAFVLVLGTVALLWYVVFPWLEPKIRFDHGTVQGDTGSSAPATPGASASPHATAPGGHRPGPVRHSPAR